MKKITEALNWRYATKKFDQTKKVDEVLLEDLLESLRLAPSSYGLQPWKFIIVKNKDVRTKIRSVAYDQPQVTEASHLVILAIKKNIDDNLVNKYLDFISQERNIGVEKLQEFGGMIKGSLIGKTNEQLRNWATHQVYLALGVFLTSCAISGVDACPMEGFDSNQVNEILGLEALNLESKVIVAVGYRDQKDNLALSKKIRFAKVDVFEEIN